MRTALTCVWALRAPDARRPSYPLAFKVPDTLAPGGTPRAGIWGTGHLCSSHREKPLVDDLTH